MNNYYIPPQYNSCVPQPSYNSNNCYYQGQNYIPDISQQNFQISNNGSPCISNNMYPQLPNHVNRPPQIGFNVVLDSVQIVPDNNNYSGNGYVPSSGYSGASYNMTNPPKLSFDGNVAAFTPGGDYGTPYKAPTEIYNSNVPYGAFGVQYNLSRDTYDSRYGNLNVSMGGNGSSHNPLVRGSDPLPSLPNMRYDGGNNTRVKNYGPPPNVSDWNSGHNNITDGSYDCDRPRTPSSDYVVPSAPFIQSPVSDTTKRKDDTIDKAGASHSSVNEDVQLTPKASSHKTNGSTTSEKKRQSEDYRKGLDKLAVLMNEDLNLTEDILRKNREKYDLNKSSY